MSNIVDLEDLKLTRAAEKALKFADEIIDSLVHLTPFKSNEEQLEDLAVLHDVAYTVAAKRLVSPGTS